MSYVEKILDIARKNNGIVTSRQVTNAGINRQNLRIMVERGLLERSERGVYIIPTILDDEMFNLQSRYRRGIFSHGTALFLLDLTDQTPIKYSMTFPLGYNTSNLNKENVEYYRVKDGLYELGVITKKTPNGNDVRVYNAERTLCDTLKGRSHTDIQIISEAFKRYAKLPNRDIPLISKYAKLMRVEKKLRAYFEVLL
ncbi:MULTISPECIES: type IV toxin-antitoxin system AbiEi family antitoxin domain-containing protein [unclassified Mesotoga]|uniref:type IV toxin-antitoxin system AbiEi family antitoxin domain-containing protein n=1 Tax=unclassified Mesotoga TaxID=1184398 RepID=UPI000DA6D79E|nr:MULTISPECIES: type IV toxin-antitoxin system AbiEi family antitoxin domain-containing protein [unclassified Mesotoga]PZC52407.1 abortive phage infection protein [Mesotoga sp. TolDC]